MRSLIAAAAAAALAAMVLSLSPRAASAGPVVVPGGGSVAGRTLPQYTADWWQSALEIPFSQSPLNDAEPTTRDVGPVTFLYGQSKGTVTRAATVEDDFIFFPVLNSFFAVTSFDPPGTTEADARAFNAAAVDEIRELHATIDGESVPMSEILTHREASPAFTLDLPADNVFGIPAEVVDVTVSDGYWLMLEPLGPGRHTISFGGQFGPTFENSTLDVTYHLNVAPSAIPLPAAALAAPALLPLAWAGRRLARRVPR